jgi:hypothetical protein
MAWRLHAARLKQTTRPTEVAKPDLIWSVNSETEGDMARSEPAMVRVSVEGRSWDIVEQGQYGFEATVDGEPTELRISEDVAYDLLGARTTSRQKCLDILRLHRADLARNLERKLRAVGHPDNHGLYFLTLHDIERTNPAERDRARGRQ